MNLRSLSQDYCDLLGRFQENTLLSGIDLIQKAIANNKSIFICGNGGSSANANLFITVMTQFRGINKMPARIWSLNSNPSILTTISERSGYETIFANQLLTFGSPDDLLITISGSGNSPNIVEAVSTAKELGIRTIGLTGMGGGKLAKLVDLALIVDSDNMEQIENIHTLIIHMWGELLAQILYCAV